MGTSRRSVSVFSLVAELCLHALVVVVPFSFGGAPAWVLWPLVLLSAAALAFAVAGARWQKKELLLAPAALVPLFLAGVCVAQLVPLPDGLLRVLSFQAAELKAFALVPLNLDGARPVTVDAPSTARELARSLAYFFALAAALQVSRSRTVRRRLLSSVALVGVALAVVGLGHKLLEAEKLFGFHAWTFAGPKLLTPFANGNHLAAYLTLAGTLALGLAVTARERAQTLLWVCGFVTAGAATVLTLSRGGLMSFAVAPVLFASLLLWQRFAKAREEQRPGEGRSWLWAALPLAAVVAVVGVGGLIAWESASERLATVSTLDRIGRTKVELWPMFFEAAKAFTVAGMGRGAFELGFTPYQTRLPSVIFTHPENVGLQLWAEAGLPAALVVLVLGAIALLRILRRGDTHALELAAVAAVGGVLLHDVFDFALELPATAVAAAVVLGAASRGEKDEGRRLKVAWAAPLTAALVLVAVFAAQASRPDFHDAEAKLGAAVAAGAKPLEVEALARTLIARHPADYALYGLAARVHSRRDGNPQEALAWVNRVLALRPLDAAAHVDAARALLRLGKPKQALLEYRLAQEAGAPNALDEGLKFARTPDDAMELVDFEPGPIQQLCGALYARGRAADGDAVLERSLSQFGGRNDAAPLWLLHSGRKAEVHDHEGALQSIAEAEKRGADPLAAARTRAAILSSDGRLEEALRVLQAQIATHPEDVELAFAISSLLHQSGRTRQAREALTRASPFITNPATRARLMLAEAAIYESESAWARAISSYQSAARLQPGVSAPHYAAARLYERLGKFDAASREVNEGVHIDGPAAAQDQALWLERLAAAQRKQIEP